MNVKGSGGGGGGRGAERTNRFKQVFPSHIKIFLAAFETLQHMLDFRSSVSCFGLG